MKDNLTKTLKPGEGFGEMALLYNAPRSAEIRCVNQCKLWGVDRITFKKALEEIITRNFEENRRFIENINKMSKQLTSLDYFKFLQFVIFIKFPQNTQN